MAPRFSKRRVIEEARCRASTIQKFNKFDLNNGWAQLRPRVSHDNTDELIERAVDYGRMRALLEVANGIEDGSFID